MIAGAQRVAGYCGAACAAAAAGHFEAVSASRVGNLASLVIAVGRGGPLRVTQAAPCLWRGCRARIQASTGCSQMCTGCMSKVHARFLAPMVAAAAAAAARSLSGGAAAAAAAGLDASAAAAAAAARGLSGAAAAAAAVAAADLSVGAAAAAAAAAGLDAGAAAAAAAAARGLNGGAAGAAAAGLSVGAAAAAAAAGGLSEAAGAGAGRRHADHVEPSRFLHCSWCLESFGSLPRRPRGTARSACALGVLGAHGVAVPTPGLSLLTTAVGGVVAGVGAGAGAAQEGARAQGAAQPWHAAAPPGHSSTGPSFRRATCTTPR